MEKIPPFSMTDPRSEDHSTQLLSGGELSVENTNVVKTEMSHLNLSKLADKTLFSHNHFSQYLQFPTVLFDGSIAPQSAVGATLYATEVSPTLMKSTRLTRVANIASNFNQWTGSMRVRMIFTKAIFMQTKIIACFLPGFTLKDADGLDVSDLYGAQYHAVMNPDNDNELSFEIPFISGKNYHNMNESTGLFIVKLFQPLVSSQPTGTSNSSIPFTLLLSSDNSTSTPLTYRYLINPSLSNNTIDQITRQDLATQLSPQVNNSIDSYKNYSTLVSNTVPDGDRFKTVAFLPTNVNVPTGLDGTLRTVNIIDAMYGNYDNADFRQPAFNCKNLVANSGYVNLSGSKLQFVDQLINSKKLYIDINEFAPPVGTFISKGRLTGITESTVDDYLVNDNRAFSVGNVFVIQKLKITTGTVYTGPVVVAFISSELPIGFDVGDYLLKPTVPMVINFSGTPAPYGLTNDWYANFTGPAKGIAFKIRQQANGCFVSYFVANMGSLYGASSTIVSRDGSTKFLTYDELPNTNDRQMFISANCPPLAVYPDNANYQSMINDFKLLRKKYLDEVENNSKYTHIMCYTSLTADQAKIAIDNGNFSNFELLDNNYYGAALDARFVSELSASERLNFIALFYAVKKGVNVVGKVVKFVEGALNFVEGFLPVNTDPDIRDGFNDNKYLLLPLNDDKPVYFESKDPVYARYFDPNILSGEIPTSFLPRDSTDNVNTPAVYRP